jgi:CheY-like chemotaxis protein
MDAMEINRPAEILLIEDNPTDARLTGKAFEEARVRNHLNVAKNGPEAMSYLRREGPHSQAPRPDLILFDLSLPRKDGFGALEEIREDHRLNDIPVVILTTSDAVKDVLGNYRLDPDGYFHMPMNINQFISMARSIADYWLNSDRLQIVQESAA